MLAVIDIIQLSPDFQNAVRRLHDALAPAAIIIAVWGLTTVALRAFHEQHLKTIMPELVRILCVALFLSYMGTVGNWAESIITLVSQETGISSNAMQALANAIYSKYGIDVSGIVGTLPQGGLSGPPAGAAGATPNGVVITHYGYEKPGDPNYDSNSANGTGNHQNTLVAASPITLANGTVSLAISPALVQSLGLTQGQTISVPYGNQGEYITGRFDDVTSSSLTNRIDVYDPTNSYAYLSGQQVGAISLAPGATQPSTMGGMFNMAFHPMETGQAALIVIISLVSSWIAAFILWIAALLQSILFNCAIAIAPLFVPFLLVPSLSNLAKTYVLGFFGICLWPISFLLMGLVTQLLIGMGMNSGNNTALGTANTLGVSFLWMLGIALWTVASAIVGPFIIGKIVTSGAATGAAEMMVGSARLTSNALAAGSSHIGRASAATSNGSSPIMSSRPAQSYATRGKS